MKICQVIETSSGGSGKTALLLIDYLIAQGHDVTLIYSPLRADDAFLNGIQSIKALRAVPIAMQRAVGLHDVFAACRLYKLLRQHGPFDIIHSHSSKAGGLARLVWVLMPSVRQIYTPHAFVTLDPAASRMYGLMEWGLSWLCAAIITVSKAEGEHAVRQLHIPAHRIHVVPNGVVQIQKFTRDEARQNLGFAEDDFVIGFVGRLEPQKQPDRAIEAFAAVAMRYPRAKLAIIGDGDLADETKALAAAKNLQDSVKFFSGRDAREFMPGFDVLLCSSDYEGFANIFLESLVDGVPIVTTPVGGSHEAVIEGKTGFVSEGFSADELAAGLVKIIEAAPQTRAEWGKLAQEHGKQFTLDKMGKKTVDVYRHVLAGQGA